MTMNNRHRRLVAGLMCVVFLISSFSTTVGAVVEIVSNTATDLIRFDWGVLDPAYGENAFAADGEGNRASKGFTLSYAELAEAVSCPAADAAVAVVDESGAQTEHPDATVNRDGSITFRKVGTAGESAFRFTLTVGGKVYGPASVTVYTYGVANSTFVLDYGLSVKLPMVQIERWDLLSLISKTNVEIDYGNEHEGRYGRFAVTGAAITYTPTEFMNGVDSMEITVQVSLPKQTFKENVTGVTMKKTLKVAPANVVYYEDDFPGITYINTGSTASDSIWAVYEGEYKVSEQSADQDMNYGSDPAYSQAGSYPLRFKDAYISDASLADRVRDNHDIILNGGLTEEEWEKIMADVPEEDYVPYPTGVLQGDASNDTIHVLDIRNAKSAALMSFEFVGTGFELISRTTTYAYAVLTVKVEALDDEGNPISSRVKPVITECVTGDLFQVPVVAFRDLAYGQYRVTVYSSNGRDVDRMLYVDGVRIYQPLDESVSDGLYKESESSVGFFEVKDGIASGKVVYGLVETLPEEGESIAWGCGESMAMIENFRGDGDPVFTLVPNKDPSEYLKYGPNNEIYLSNLQNHALSYIAFYVVLDPDYEGERSIQIGAHMKSYSGGDNTGVSLRYGNTAEDFWSQDNTISVVGGTEQYYTVDIDWNPQHPNGIDQTVVVIGIDNKNNNDVLSLTNIKLNGYKLATKTFAEISAVQDEYDINACILMSRVVAISDALPKED